MVGVEGLAPSVHNAAQATVKAEAKAKAKAEAEAEAEAGHGVPVLDGPVAYSVIHSAPTIIAEKPFITVEAKRTVGSGEEAKENEGETEGDDRSGGAGEGDDGSGGGGDGGGGGGGGASALPSRFSLQPSSSVTKLNL